MTVSSFLVLLSVFAVINSLVVEAVKKVISEENKKYNVITLVTALVVGGVGTLVFYQLTGVPFSINNVICAVLMGLASGLTSMIGYDKVKQAIEQFKGV